MVQEPITIWFTVDLYDLYRFNGEIGYGQIDVSMCGSEEESVSVQAVSMVAGGGGMLVDRCAGKVVSGDTAKLSKDSGKTVLEVLVQEGDMVAEGDLLFRYDAAAMELELEKLRLEKQGMENTIATATADIEELERQKAMVYVTNQLSYTIQIDSKKADLREAEYNKVIKEREIANMETALQATDITFSEVDTISHLNVDNDYIYVCGSDADYNHHVYVYDKTGKLIMTLAGEDGEGLGSVTFVAKVNGGFMGLDGNLRDVVFWDASGNWAGSIEDGDLFGTYYPWFCGGTVLEDGSVLILMTEDRADESAMELVAFKVTVK